MVDRIGKGGAPPTASPTPRSKETGKTFDVENTAAARPVEQVASIQPTALDQLKAGKIDFKQYLDAKVHEATSHLEGLSVAHIDALRATLRDRMATDPELIDLIKAAAGQAPSPDE